MYKPPDDRILFARIGSGNWQGAPEIEPLPAVQPDATPPAPPVNKALQAAIAKRLDRRSTGAISITLRLGQCFSGVRPAYSPDGCLEGTQERIRWADPHEARTIAIEKAARSFLKSTKYEASFESAAAALSAEYERRHQAYLTELNRGEK